MKSAERDGLLSLITPTADYGALADCDLVIEAVFEDRKVKFDVMEKIQAVIAARRSLPRTPRRCRSRRSPRASRSRHVSSHPFLLAGRPHDAGRDHSRQGHRDKALAAALDYVRAIRKTPIVVNDSRGFYTSRVVAPTSAKAI